MQTCFRFKYSQAPNASQRGFRTRMVHSFAKSRIGGTGMDQATLQRFAAILSCDTMAPPFIYLGLPVGGSHKRGAFWNRVIEKVQARLSRWKGRSFFDG